MQMSIRITDPERRMKMKRIYETPEVLLTENRETDVITTSGGDTPLVDAFDW